MGTELKTEGTMVAVTSVQNSPEEALGAAWMMLVKHRSRQAPNGDRASVWEHVVVTLKELPDDEHPEGLPLHEAQIIAITG